MGLIHGSGHPRSILTFWRYQLLQVQQPAKEYQRTKCYTGNRFGDKCRRALRGGGVLRGGGGKVRVGGGKVRVGGGKVSGGGG